MKKKWCIGGCLFLLSLGVWAQEDPVLMRVNGLAVRRSVFEQAYHRHLQEAKEPLSKESYAQLFAERQLALQLAKSDRLDTLISFRSRLAAYRNALLRSYLTDAEAAEQQIGRLYRQLKENRHKGMVQVVELFKSLPQNATPARIETERARMDSLSLVLGEHLESGFSSVLSRFSDRQDTLWLCELEMTAELAEVAYALPVGGVSRPFFTPEGIHLVRVLAREELPDYETFRNRLGERRIPHSVWNKATEKYVDRLKRERNWQPNPKAMHDLLSEGTTDDVLFSIDGQTYTGAQFRRFASSFPTAVQRQLDAFVTKSLLDAEYRRIEDKHPEWKHRLQSYADSCLIAEAQRTEAQLRPPTSQELSEYFRRHADAYRWELPRYRGAVLHCVDKKTAKRVKKLLKKTPEQQWAALVEQHFTSPNGEKKVRMEQGLFAIGMNPYVDKKVFKQGSYVPVPSHPFLVVWGEKQKGPKDYREAGEQVLKDYLDWQNRQWMQSLRARGEVEIDQEVLKTVKNK